MEDNIFLETILYLLENKFYFKLSCPKNIRIIILEPEVSSINFQFGFELNRPIMKTILNEIVFQKNHFPTKKELFQLLRGVPKFKYSTNLENVFISISHFIDYNYPFYFKIEKAGPTITDIHYKILFKGNEIFRHSFFSKTTETFSLEKVLKLYEES